MTIQHVTENERSKFEAVSKSLGSVFPQSWTWGEWQQKNNIKVYRYIGTDKSAPLLCAQVLKQPLSPLRGWYTHTIYGPTIRLDLDIQSQTKILRQFSDFLLAEHPGIIFSRFEPCGDFKNSLPIFAKKSLNTHPSKTITLNLEQSSDSLLKNMHHKTSYNIRLAQRHAVIVKNTPLTKNSLNSETQKALSLINDTQSRQGYRGHTQTYLQSLVNFLSQEATDEIKTHLYTAYYQDTLVASGLFIDYNHVRTYVYGGSLTEHRNVMAPYLLHWKAIQDAQNENLKTYDLGGAETTSGKTPGFLRFKEGFGGTMLVFSGAWDIVYKPTHYWIYSMLRSLNRRRLR